MNLGWAFHCMNEPWLEPPHPPRTSKVLAFGHKAMHHHRDDKITWECFTNYYVEATMMASKYSELEEVCRGSQVPIR